MSSELLPKLFSPSLHLDLGLDCARTISRAFGCELCLFLLSPSAAAQVGVAVLQEMYIGPSESPRCEHSRCLSLSRVELSSVLNIPASYLASSVCAPSFSSVSPPSTHLKRNARRRHLRRRRRQVKAIAACSIPNHLYLYHSSLHSSLSVSQRQHPVEQNELVLLRQRP